MSIQQRGGAWQVYVKRGGERVRLNAKSEAQAVAWETAIIEAIEAGKALDLDAIRGIGERGTKTLGEVFAVVASLVWSRKKAGAAMVALAEQVKEELGANTAIDKLTTSDVDGMISRLVAKGNSSATVNRKLAALSVAVRFAIKRNWRRDGLHLEYQEEGEGRKRFMSDVEETALLAATQHFGHTDEADLFVFLLDTGFRVREALSLDWRNVDMMNGLITVEGRKSKNGVTRAIPYTDRVYVMLYRRRNLPSPFPMGYWDVYRVWERIRTHLDKQSDPEWVMHMLRHTCASRLVQRGVPLLVVKEWMGHKSLAMTERYAHLVPANFASAVAALNAPLAKQVDAGDLKSPSDRSAGSSPAGRTSYLQVIK